MIVLSTACEQTKDDLSSRGHCYFIDKAVSHCVADSIFLHYSKQSRRCSYNKHLTVMNEAFCVLEDVN